MFLFPAHISMLVYEAENVNIYRSACFIGGRILLRAPAADMQRIFMINPNPQTAPASEGQSRAL